MAGSHLRRPRPPLRTRRGRRPRAGLGATLRRADRRPAGLAGSGVEYPPPVIATRSPGRPARIAFGSCRTSVSHDRQGNRRHGVDSLRAFALAVADGRAVGPTCCSSWATRCTPTRPEGDAGLHPEPARHPRGAGEGAQGLRGVRASLRARVVGRRESMAPVHAPRAMIFDDHDIRDDWNASLDWKRKMEATSWWHGRIVAGLASYWVYQHLGNLSPRARAEDEVWGRSSATTGRGARPHRRARRVRRAMRRRARRLRLELLPGLRRRAADRRRLACGEGSDAVGSRTAGCPGARMARRADARWIPAPARGQLAAVPAAPGPAPRRGLDQAFAQGAWGRPAAWIGERLRQAVDLEHWAPSRTASRPWPASRRSWPTVNAAQRRRP